MVKDYHERLASEASTKALSSLSSFEEKAGYSTALQVITENKPPTYKYFDDMARMKSLDEYVGEIDSKRVVLRIHLKLNSDPELANKRV